jgi:hypothetical protein
MDTFLIFPFSVLIILSRLSYYVFLSTPGCAMVIWAYKLLTIPNESTGPCRKASLHAKACMAKRNEFNQELSSIHENRHALEH